MVHIGKGTTLPPLPIGGASIKSGRVKGMELSKLEQLMLISVLSERYGEKSYYYLIENKFDFKEIRRFNRLVDKMRDELEESEIASEIATNAIERVLIKTIRNFIAE